MKQIKRVDILAIGAHPDDQELSCGGTLLKESQAGKTIGLLDLTRGEMGTRGTPEIRRQEALAAADMIGAEFRYPLDLGDGFLQMDREAVLQVIQVIRAARPDIVLANALKDRHTDHGKGAKLVHEACFLSGLKSLTTRWDGDLQDPWRPRALYHYIQDYHMSPDVVVDISGFMDAKMDLIMQYKSQFYDPQSTEPHTPISSPEFLDFLRARALQYGRPAGLRYAEGFTTSRYPAVSSLSDLL